jgi:hypothetical protein
MMQGPINLRFTNAKQAKIMHEYKNIVVLSFVPAETAQLG